MHIYPIRSYGNRLPSEFIRQHKAYGWLDFRQIKTATHLRGEARLLDVKGGRDLIAPLQWARVRRVDGVLHLAGKQDYGRPNLKAKPVWRSQSWLCAYTQEDAEEFLARMVFDQRVSLIASFFPDDVYE